MSQHSPLLSIGIPTYKRRLHLDILLRHLCPQLTPDAEVIIVENPSVDESESLVATYKQKMPSLRYIRNETNIFLNGSYKVVFEQATAPWVIVLGDDEIPAPYFVQTLIKQINYDDADLLLCNFQKYTATGLYGPPSQLFSTPFEGAHSFCDDESLCAYFDSVINLSGVFSFISNVVLRKQVAQEYAIPEFLKSASFPHAWRCLQMLRGGARLRYVSTTPIYSIRGNDSKDFSDLIQRAWLDISGYQTIGHDIFGQQPEVLHSLMSVVVRELRGYVASSLPRACVYRIFSKKDSWENFITWMQQYGGTLPTPLKHVQAFSRVFDVLEKTCKPLLGGIMRHMYKDCTSQRRFSKSTWLHNAHLDR